jgi:ethanolamine utilization protein EutQ (cupin superfamily)
MSIEHFRIEDVAQWYQHTDRQIFLADVVNSSSGDTMSVWFGRYGPGESNEWTLAYDEVIFVIEGRFTVRDADGAKTARPGEVIFLTKGAKVTYEAEVGTRLAGATYPHWQDAQRRSPHAHMLGDFHLA